MPVTKCNVFVVTGLLDWRWKEVRPETAMYLGR